MPVGLIGLMVGLMAPHACVCLLSGKSNLCSATQNCIKKL